jgi:glycosyltransferase involved in cell wall biosynthesis
MIRQSKRSVSVIMRSKNSDWVIDRALAALFSQTFTDFELTVVDSGSTDRTLEIVRKYPCRLIQIEAKSYFPGAVLNSAIENTSGELIVFQNSDAVPLCQDSLAQLVAAFDEEKVQAAFGRQVPRPEALPWVRRDYAASFPDHATSPPWMTLSLPFAAMRRSIWREHPFYTDAWASEDTEWGHWARQNGHLVHYVPEAVVMHSHNYTLRQLYGRRFVEGEADAFIYGGGDSFGKMAARVAGSTLRDAVRAIQHGQLREVPLLPFRRAVYHWAHFRGHAHGNNRRLTEDTNTNFGQDVVLSRYEK